MSKLRSLETVAVAVESCRVCPHCVWETDCRLTPGVRIPNPKRVASFCPLRSEAERAKLLADYERSFLIRTEAISSIMNLLGLYSRRFGLMFDSNDRLVLPTSAGDEIILDPNYIVEAAVHPECKIAFLFEGKRYEFFPDAQYAPRLYSRVINELSEGYLFHEIGLAFGKR